MTNAESILLCVFAITAIAGAAGALVLQRSWQRWKRPAGPLQSRQALALFGLLAAFATLGSTTALVVGRDAAARQAALTAVAVEPDVRGNPVPPVIVAPKTKPKDVRPKTSVKRKAGVLSRNFRNTRQNPVIKRGKASRKDVVAVSVSSDEPSGSGAGGSKAVSIKMGPENENAKDKQDGVSSSGTRPRHPKLDP